MSAAERKTLTVELRDPKGGSARKLRARGYVPGIVYGKEISPLAIQVRQESLARLTRGGHHAGLVELAFPDRNDSRLALVKEIQRCPVTGRILHVDFHQVSLKERVRARVPVVVFGEEALLKSGAVLQHQLEDVEVESLPQDIPDEIVVDVSNLRPGAHVRVSDLRLPQGVKCLTEEDEVVLSVLAPRAEVEEVPAAEAGGPGATGAT